MQAITPTGPSRSISPTLATDQPSLSTLPAELQKDISTLLSRESRLKLASTCKSMPATLEPSLTSPLTKLAPDTLQLIYNKLDSASKASLSLSCLALNDFPSKKLGNYTDPTHLARQVFFRTKEYREFAESLGVRETAYQRYNERAQQTIIEGCIQAMLSPTHPNRRLAAPILKQYLKGISNLELSFSFSPENEEKHPIYAQRLAVALKHHSSIQTIFMENKVMQNIGLNALIHSLENNTTLKSLSLDNASITDTNSLSNWLKTNSSLTELSLNDNSLSAIALTELTDALETNKTLKKLYLFGITIPQECIEDLASTLTHHSKYRLRFWAYLFRCSHKFYIFIIV